MVPQKPVPVNRLFPKVKKLEAPALLRPQVVLSPMLENATLAVPPAVAVTPLVLRLLSEKDTVNCASEVVASSDFMPSAVFFEAKERETVTWAC